MARTGTGRRPLLCGYYGEHNLGDDALLEVLLHQLPPKCEPLVTAHDQRWVAERFKVATCDRRRLLEVLRQLAHCEVLVLGGGSLLQDATSLNSLLYYCLLIVIARLRGRAVVLWGQGLGPLRRPVSRLLTRAVLPLATAISWRDGASAQLAERLGSRRHAVGSDPVWAYPGRQWRGKGGPIVLCWRPLAALEPGGWGPYLQALAAVVEDSGREVLWLPFHQGQDRGLLARLEGAGLVPEAVMARSREVAVGAPAEAMDVFARAGLVVAMRLHGLILAALAGSPVAALSYDPKVAAAARGLGCPLQELEGPADPRLAASWGRQLDQPPSPETIAALRAETAVHARLLGHPGVGLGGGPRANLGLSGAAG
ncbi:MAG: polysaccharide pyruvyl transferase CsaB [Cyanobacteriota bacterium]|nr:polysaccharide pyruvyl transferase CsaB [Cyanobacteriota bacterium]